MATDPVQNYANHRTVDYRLYVIVALLLLAIFGSFAPFPILNRIVVPLIAVSVAMLALVARQYATRLQDRIIRMEMRERLARVLPAPLASRTGELELTHIIGLRYASDEELPGLIEKVLANKSMRADDIKRLVTQWQADHLRV